MFPLKIHSLSRRIAHPQRSGDRWASFSVQANRNWFCSPFPVRPSLQPICRSHTRAFWGFPSLSIERCHDITCAIGGQEWTLVGQSVDQRSRSPAHTHDSSGVSAKEKATCDIKSQAAHCQKEAEGMGIPKMFLKNHRHAGLISFHSSILHQRANALSVCFADRLSDTYRTSCRKPRLFATSGPFARLLLDTLHWGSVSR